jgi:DNA primase
LIPKNTIDNILSASHIEEVIGEFVVLKRRGTNYIGLCPFHNEKTPSFTVSPAKGIYKCFGCGKAGNTVNFIMEYEHYSYPEALRFLAKRYNIEIEEEVQTPEKIQEQNEKESLFLVNQFAQKYFENILHESEEGKSVGLTYLKERSFSESTIRKFQLGYGLDKWDDMSAHALMNGYKSEYLVKTGVSVQKDDHLTDRFRGRVIFPIHSPSGRIIGFGGRILTSDKHLAKYINSPESEIYNKSKSLYGLFFAKNSIISKDNCFLVEGYTDVISLHQAGIENVVASSGTSLTQDQIKMIQRYTKNITILYDGDPAGIKASMRGIDMILEQGLNVKIVLFPEGEDPDSFVRKSRVAEVEFFIDKNAVNFILFKTRLLLEEASGDPIKKASLIKEIVKTISLIPDPISKSLYTKQCSEILNINEQTLLNEINKILRKKLTQPDQEYGRTDTTSGMSPELSAPTQIEYDLESNEAQEHEIIRLLLLYGNDIIVFKKENEDKELTDISIRIGDFIIHDIVNDEIRFDNEHCQKIFDEIAASLDQEIIRDKDFFFQYPDKEIAILAIDLCMVPYSLSHNWKKNDITVPLETDDLNLHIISALHTFKAKKIEKMIMENAKKLKEIQGNKDALEEITYFLTNQIKYEEIRKKIQADELGRTIIK